MGPGKTIKLMATGEVDSMKAPVSGVVWNPNKERAKKLGDFGDEKCVDMICVDPDLSPDRCWRGQRRRRVPLASRRDGASPSDAATSRPHRRKRKVNVNVANRSI